MVSLVSDSVLSKRRVEFYFPGFQAHHVGLQIAGLCFLVPVPAISLFILARQQAAVVKTPLALLLELGHPIQPNHDHLHLVFAKGAAWLHLRIVHNILFQAEVLWIPLYDQWYRLHQHTGNLYNYILRFVLVPCVS